MKKTVIIIFSILVTLFCINNLFGFIHDTLVWNEDVGMSISADTLKKDKITMMQFYSAEISVDSAQKRPLSILLLGAQTDLDYYKNDKLIAQNHNYLLTKYTDKAYIKINIIESDYNDKNICMVKMDIIPSMANKNVTQFIGDSDMIDDFLILVYIVKNIILVMAIISSLIMFFIAIQNKNLYLLILSMSIIISFFNFDIGINGALVSVFLFSDNILKRKKKVIVFVLCIFLLLMIPKINIFIIVFIGIKIYDLIKKHSYVNMISLIFLSLFYAVYSFDYEFSVLKTFYDKINIFIFILFGFVYGGYYFSTIFKKYDGSASVELLRGISHDFKIPLSVIKINTEIMSEGDFDTQAERNKINFSTENAIIDLEKMINSLTTYLYKGNYVSKGYNTSIKECFEKVERNFKRYNNNINFIVKCDEVDAFLPIDPIWFDRLIYNLVDNAFKYSYDDGDVTLEYKWDSKNIIITVTDTGIGMNKDELRKIFIPFYRVDKSRSKNGLGLGLSVIKSIVDNLEGDIKVKSIEGEGTTFVVEI